MPATARCVITIDEGRDTGAERAQGRPWHGRIRHDPRAHWRCRNWRRSGHGKHHSEQLLEPDCELRHQRSNALPNLLLPGPLQLRRPLGSRGLSASDPTMRAVTSKEVSMEQVLTISTTWGTNEPTKATIPIHLARGAKNTAADARSVPSGDSAHLLRP